MVQHFVSMIGWTWGATAVVAVVIMAAVLVLLVSR
jgi:hypothetical protein